MINKKKNYNGDNNSNKIYNNSNNNNNVIHIIRLYGSTQWDVDKNMRLFRTRRMPAMYPYAYYTEQ